MELLLKFSAYGLQAFSDKSSKFDIVVVVLTTLDGGMSFAAMLSGGSGVQPLRSVRVLRSLRVLNALKFFRYVLFMRANLA